MSAEPPRTIRSVELADRLARLEPLFGWLRWFYPAARGMSFIYLAWCFIPQKVLRINGPVPWPVHFTSRVLYWRRIRVGAMCAPGLNSGCYVQGRGGIEIGDNLRMGPNVGLISSNHELDDYDQGTAGPPIRIGSNVWIGMNAVILPGVSIGDNVVIGAGSVVREDIPANSIAAGNPCRVLREKPPYRGRDYGAAR